MPRNTTLRPASGQRNVRSGPPRPPAHPPRTQQKLRWYRRGGEVSDRQWRDVVAIVRVQGSHLDWSYLAANAPTLGVADLLARALDEV